LGSRRVFLSFIQKPKKKKAQPSLVHAVIKIMDFSYT